jgi:flavin reductase (DIM6/NTAB) family NADH-FMN oxidoreductase RutF
MKSITLSDIENMEKLARVQFANSLPDPKPISLVATINPENHTNLAPCSTITHLGSNPALIGLISLPTRLPYAKHKPH